MRRLLVSLIVICALLTLIVVASRELGGSESHRTSPVVGVGGASFSLQTGSVTHTLPYRFVGVSDGIANYQDVQNPAWVALVNQLQPEFWRMFGFDLHFGTPANPTPIGLERQQFAAAVTRYAQAHGLPLPGFASSPGAGTINPYGSQLDLGNVDQGDRGPANHVAWLKWWLDNYPPIGGHGRIVYDEVMTEPASEGNATGACPRTELWFCSASADFKAEEWAAIQLRNYYTPLKALASTYPDPPLIGGMGYAEIGGLYGHGGLDDQILGTTWGAGWPWPNTNIPFLDVYTYHGYSLINTGSTNQESYNQFFYPTFSTGNSKSGYLAGAAYIRTLLDSNGGTNVQEAMTEYEPKDDGKIYATGALGDVGIALVSADEQATDKLQAFVYMDVNTDSLSLSGATEGDGLILSENGTLHTSVRFATLRDMIIPFIRTYKDQISFTDPTTAGVGLTPATALDNAVPRVQLAAGLDPSHRELGVLIANFDLSTPQTVTLKLDRPISATVTGKKLLQSQPIDTPLPNITIDATGASTLTLKLTPGEADYLEIPLARTTSGIAAPSR